MSENPALDYSGRQIGHFRVIERITDAPDLAEGKTWWRCICDVCGEWKEVSTSHLRKSEIRERSLGIQVQCRQCTRQQKAGQNAKERSRGNGVERSPRQWNDDAPPQSPTSDSELAIAIAELIGLDHSVDNGGWPYRTAAKSIAERFDPANNWNDAILALRIILGDNSDSPCRTFYRDLEFVLAGSTAILPDWPHAFRLLIEQGPRCVCAAILRCCPAADRSEAVVRS
ncbi:MAG: hypothetical protein IT428_02405 [Planctomycetaceae bacterium]|nr:hypothetical protein [Planctomycetaceae bacterium]